MIFYIHKRIQREFNKNLNDWFQGGPKLGGWTRFGSGIDKKRMKIVGYEFKDIDVDDGLAKNLMETQRWHISFLKGKEEFYRSEYLSTRYDSKKCDKIMFKFKELFKDIQLNGVKDRIWVADVSELNLNFNYFRFDGCHRLCCCKVLGIKTIPAIVFKATLF